MNIEQYIVEQFELTTKTSQEVSDNHFAPANTIIDLPKPYLVPGDRFQEMYYWDSFFQCLGLRKLGQWQKIIDIAENIAYLIEQYGYMPNGNRTFYLGRSQPPFFGQIIKLIEESPLISKQQLDRFYKALKTEYYWWVLHRTNVYESYGYSFYSSDRIAPRVECKTEDLQWAKNSLEPERVYENIRATCESGWDFSSRWFVQKASSPESYHLSKLRTLQFAPIDLNCLLFDMRVQLQNYFGEEAFSEYSINPQLRSYLIKNLCFDETTGMFKDYNTKQQKVSPHDTIATAFPLWLNLASSEQAEATAKNIEDKFLKKGGVITTTENSNQQWDSPNGWAPLQWICIQGLNNYGFTSLADTIKNRWLKTCQDNYSKTGVLEEKYNVIDPISKPQDGEYPNQRGFGWTNGVYLDLL